MVFSYLELRKAIGILAFALPFVLSLGALIFFQTDIRNSISGYYYTGMRDVFVGIICAIAFFMLSYKGYKWYDNLAGNLGCIFAIGIALFPETPDGDVTKGELIIGHIHLACAALFFLTLIFFSFFLFTKTDKNKLPSWKKLKRNIIYRACGILMFLCILFIATYLLLPKDMIASLAKFKPIFWLETIAIWAFGVSWLTKGEAILKDEV